MPRLNTPLLNTQRIIVLGLCLLFLGVGGFLVWSMTAKLESASIASGQLVVESERKKIQHLAGGWVKAIHVKEGQRVEPGDLLIELSDAHAEANYQQVYQRVVSLEASQIRLKAQLKNQEALDFSALQTIQMSAVQNIYQHQRLLFEQARLQQQMEQSQYEQQGRLLAQQEQGTVFQLRAVARQLSLIAQEIQMTKQLLEKGYVAKTKLLELQRHHASVRAHQAELQAQKSVLKEQIVALKQAYEAQQLAKRSQYTQELALNSEALRDAKQALHAVTDVRKRVEIRSEHQGVVVGLSVHSVGGVVRPGQVLMELVPVNDNLVVEVTLSPQDIDLVRVGMPARIRLSAYNVRTTPAFAGTVIHVDADRLNQSRESSQSGYQVRIAFEQAELERFNSIELYPGMPAEVYVLHESRTMMDYLLAPLQRGYYRAFREAS
ncbi:Type I secretion system membrane fusion protein PrsE [Vibrio stylophorae]|uniref:Membrane fusion protein (MFP) family protein n=1 Tax=Vibrio stylophorae TaxID=659351 RepID=A0ABN8DVZ3_9VIBR|nr:HlyD family type I secretion periplasmic adaptor subunit [Vibrio stylophorae]CAH0533517.1 Type I secretion system membrane fusion protein PrsE [Vibrio stylophorae]